MPASIATEDTVRLMLPAHDDVTHSRPIVRCSSARSIKEGRPPGAMVIGAFRNAPGRPQGGGTARRDDPRGLPQRTGAPSASPLAPAARRGKASAPSPGAATRRSSTSVGRGRWATIELRLSLARAFIRAHRDGRDTATLARLDEAYLATRQPLADDESYED